MLARCKFLLAFCIMHFAIGRSAFADTPDPNTYYRLNTEYRGDGTSLDVFNGTKNNFLHLVPTQNTTGQFWRFVSNGDGTFKMTTQFRGPDMCLDVVNGGANNNEPHLTPCGNYQGQQWMVVPDGPWVRFKTKFRGEDTCLDIFNGGPNDNQPYFKPCGNFSGQRWRLTAAKPVVPMTRDGKQIVYKVCKWFGTAPICKGECPAGWSFEGSARTGSEGNRMTWIMSEATMPVFGETCAPFTTKVICCRFQ
jgi:hypothetical protein